MKTVIVLKTLFKSLVIPGFLAILPLLTFSQTCKPGTIEYLKALNGFNGLVLGSNAFNLPEYKLAYMDNMKKFDADSCILYEYRDHELLKIDDDLNLASIALRTYKDKIVNIYLFFNKNEGFKVLGKFLFEYGQFTDKPNDYDDIYNWNCSTIKVSLRYQKELEMGMAIFTCTDIDQEIKDKKSRLLQQILLSNN